MSDLTPLQMSNLLHALEAAEIAPGKEIPLGAAALYYATAVGWPVFPLRPRSKQPLTEHGFKDATRDTVIVGKWWRGHPDANIGLPTGPVCDGGIGFDVIDIDGAAGMASFSEIRADLPPVRYIAFTPGDPTKERGPGRHLYVAATGDGSSAGYLTGMDYKGVGGYVVAPPSRNLAGACYAWLEGAKP